MGLAKAKDRRFAAVQCVDSCESLARTHPVLLTLSPCPVAFRSVPFGQLNACASRSAGLTIVARCGNLCECQYFQYVDDANAIKDKMSANGTEGSGGVPAQLHDEPYDAPGAL